MRQKSIIQLLGLKDTNSTFFFASMKNRISQNHINILISDDGVTLTTKQDVEDEFIGFYKRLLGTNASELPDIHPKVMACRPVLTRKQQLKLQAPITRDEINQALKDTNDLKEPGCDGFNAYFFKKSWTSIGDEVTNATLQFFHTKQMFKAINCTTVTLIPKVQNPSSVRESIPISCFSMLYKLISKVLTKRLQVVMNSIIDNGQSTFVPEMVITDNILLSYEIFKRYGRKGISPRCMLKIDMQNAYDSVECTFLEQVLVDLNFLACFVD